MLEFSTFLNKVGIEAQMFIACIFACGTHSKEYTLFYFKFIVTVSMQNNKCFCPTDYGTEL